MRILIVEDDEILAHILVSNLTANHYAVDVADDGESGWDYAQAVPYDLIMLDIDLPRLDGINLCRRLRQGGYGGPMLLLTAKNSSADKVQGLDAGADDYVVKPCSTEELCARIRALLRRRETSIGALLEWGELRVDPTSCEVTYQGHPVSLSSKEYSLLELFLRSPRRVFSSSVILEHIWAFDDSPGEDTVRAHIKRLRKKLKAVGADDVIETIYGIGYRLKPITKDDSSTEEPTSTTPHLPTVAPTSLDSSPSPSDQARLAALEIWEQFKAPTLERLSALDEAVAAWYHNCWSDEIRQRAECAAHKLVGSLGMFGFPQGSVIAREIETWLQQNKTQMPSAIGRLEIAVANLHYEIQQPLNAWDSPMTSLAGDCAKLSPGNNPTLLAVIDDDALATVLQQHTVACGIQFERVRRIDDGLVLCQKVQPKAVLIYYAQADNLEYSLQGLEAFSAQLPQTPLMVLTHRSDLQDRLALARRQIRACLSASLPMTQLMAVIQDVVKPNPNTIRVMAVDDDPAILTTLERMLPSWGIDVRSLNDPRRFWLELTTHAPDILILDIEMPHATGLELCRVVRNDATWNGLPILFLSSRRDPETICQIYNIGADDYIAKPFTEPELVARIFNRIERNRLLKNRVEIDPLTGVWNRQHGTREFNRHLSLAHLQRQSLGVALIHLDNFKHINQHYGYDVGDSVLQHIALTLQRLFPPDVLLVRWSGAKFLIGVRGQVMAELDERLQKMMQMFRQDAFNTQTEPFYITLSGGLAEFPEHGYDLPSLHRLLDLLLAEAKMTGGDRLIMAE